MSVGILKCTFEALVCTEIEKNNFSMPLKTYYHSLSHCDLYLFTENGDGSFTRCRGVDDITVTANDQTADSDLYECNYSFERGKKYYGYFSSKKLYQEEIQNLQTTNSDYLIEILPKGAGRIQIGHSLFFWILLLGYIENKLIDKSRLLETLIDIYDDNITNIYEINEARTQEVLQNFKNNAVVILKDGTFISIPYFLKGIFMYKEEGIHLLDFMHKKINDEMKEIDENPDEYFLGGNYNFNNLNNKSAYTVSPPICLFSAIQAFLFLENGNEINSASFEKFLHNISVDEDLISYRQKTKKYYPPSVIDVVNNIKSFTEDYKNMVFKAFYENVIVEILNCKMLSISTGYKVNFRYETSFYFQIDSNKVAVDIISTTENKTVIIKIDRIEKGKIILNQSNNRRIQSIDTDTYNCMKDIYENLSYVYEVLLKDPEIPNIPIILLKLRAIFGKSEFYV